MTLTIDVSADIEGRITREAARAGLTPTEYARRLIEQALPADGGKPMTGAEAIAYWEREGVFGLFSDRGDVTECARALRRQAAL